MSGAKSIHRFLVITVCLIALGTAAAAAEAADAPGAPGDAFRWDQALKQAVGTSYEAQGAQSPVWFTLANGIVTEVFYPHVDQPQVGDLEFLVANENGFFSEQKRDTAPDVTYDAHGAATEVQGTDRSGSYSYQQQIITDPNSPALRIRTQIKWLNSRLQQSKVYVLFKPAINNTGSGNLARATDHSLLATRDMSRNSPKPYPTRIFSEVHTALMTQPGFNATSAGYVGISDGWQELSKNFKLSHTYPTAGPGNIALIGEVSNDSGKNSDTFTFEISLGFSDTEAGAESLAQDSLKRSFDTLLSQYNSGWMNYLSNLSVITSLSQRSVQIIKMHEDKLVRGAIVASLSKPGIPDGDTAGDQGGGYHLIWPRDLYHASMGLLAAGDINTPLDILNFYHDTQKTDGSWSQNMWIDGTAYWPGQQMDEVAFPIALAGQLKKRGLLPHDPSIIAMVSAAARFIQSHGPMTGQDRWEEIGGYVPSTIAAEIMGLRFATQITGDSSFEQTASEWIAQLSNWVVVPQGQVGDHSYSNYFLRVSPNGHPESPVTINIANNGGSALASSVIDGGFLELVRMGVISADDPRVISTLAAYDNPANGVAGTYSDSNGACSYRRYNQDGYGFNHVGGFWPLLSGERGHYAILARDMDRARAQLANLEAAALTSGDLPEQTIDAATNPQVGVGVAAPLVWAHAEQLRLQRSIEDGAVFDQP